MIDLLVFGPHLDDLEIGLGGTIARHVAQGSRVGLCDLTAGELGSNGTVDERLAEAERARAVLGAVWRENLRWPDRGIGKLISEASGEAGRAFLEHRGLGDDVPDRLRTMIFPLESKLVDRDVVYWGALHGMVEMIEGGVTTLADMYYFENEVARAAVKITSAFSTAKRCPRGDAPAW